MATRTLSFKARIDYTITDVSKTTYSFPFVYLKKKFIQVYIRDAEGNMQTLTYGKDYMVDNQEVTILTTSLLVLNHTLSIRRETTTDSIVTWNDGSVLLAADMTLEQVQLLHLQEEQRDYLEANTISVVETENKSFFNANNLSISNVADPIDAQDAVTKHYIESVQDGFVQRNQKIETNVKSMQTDVSSKQQQALASQTAAANSANLSKAWAVSTATPDDTADTESTTGKTQSSRTWALFSKVKSQEAATAATNAKASETKAKVSETNANTLEQAAATSATNAKTSETNAKTSETNAKTSETNASDSEMSARASEDNARTSETNAANSAKQAAESAGVFQDFTGATATADGTGGKVPKPLAGEQEKYLKADGTWSNIDKLTPNTLWGALHFYPNNYVPSDLSNIGWNQLGFCSIYYTQNKINNQPTQYGQLINIPADKGDESTQLWVEQNNGNLFSRGGNRSNRVDDTAFKRFATLDDVGKAEKVDSQGNNWIRYKSGLQLCWVHSTQSNRWWSFPVAFSATPAVQLSSLDGSHSVGFNSNVSTTGCQPIGNDRDDDDIPVSVFAIGRWK